VRDRRLGRGDGGTDEGRVLLAKPLADQLRRLLTAHRVDLLLDGLGLLNRDAAKRAMAATPGRQKQAREIVDSMRRQFAAAASRAVGHRAFLEAL